MRESEELTNDIINENNSFIVKPQYESNIDNIVDGVLFGWARNKHSDLPLDIIVLINKRLAGKVTADTFREDLLKAGIGNGKHGYSLVLDKISLDIDQDSIDIRIINENNIVSDVKLSVTPTAIESKFDHKASKNDFVGFIENIEDRKVIGWIKSEVHDDPIDIILFGNGNIIGKGLANIYREDLVQSGFSHGCFGFEITIENYNTIKSQNIKLEIQPTSHKKILSNISKECSFEFDELTFQQVKEDSIQGHIDFIEDYIEGWVVTENDKTFVEVEINEKIKFQAENNILRQDVIDAGYTDTNAGFKIPISEIALCELHQAIIKVDGRFSSSLTSQLREYVLNLENSKKTSFSPLLINDQCRAESELNEDEGKNNIFSQLKVKVDSFFKFFSISLKRNKKYSIQGHIDFIKDYVEGWVVTDDQITVIEIEVNEQVKLQAENNILRQDVIDAGYTNKNSGFKIPISDIALCELYQSTIKVNNCFSSNLTNQLKEHVLTLEKSRKNSFDPSVINDQYHTELEHNKTEEKNIFLLQLNNKLKNRIDLNPNDSEKLAQRYQDQILLTDITHAKKDLDAKKIEFELAAKSIFDRDISSQEVMISLERKEYLDVTIILVLYNKVELTYQCLKSIEAMDKPPRVVIINNASTDNSSELMEKTQGIEYIYNAKNIGFLKACNQAREYVKTKYILLLNNDAILHPNAISFALDVFDRQSNVGAVGSKILHLDGFLQEAGSFIWQDGSCQGYGRRDNHRLPQYNFIREVDYVSGAFLLIESGLWDELDGFDEDYAPCYYEESDLCMRIKAKGKRIIYQPKSVITHFEFGSSSQSDFATQQMKKNSTIFFHKHEQALQSHIPPLKENIFQAAMQSEKPKLLFIEDQIPFDKLGAGFPRSRQILLELKQYFQIIFYPCIENQYFEEDDSYSDILILQPNSKNSSTLLDSVSKILDVVWVSRPHNMQKLIDSGLYKNITQNSPFVIYDAEAIFSERERLRCKLFNLGFDEKIQQNELDLLSNADAVVSVSHRESSLLSSYTDKPIFKIAHPMERESAQLKLDSNKSKNEILFVGNLTGSAKDSPNVDSINYFMENYFKKITSLDIKLRLVGRIDQANKELWEKQGAICEGGVDNLNPYFDKAICTIAPTRFAAGIPHKVHESLSRGIPILGSELILKQIGLEPDIENGLIKADVFEKINNRSFLEKVLLTQLKVSEDDMNMHSFKKTINHIYNLSSEIR